MLHCPPTGPGRGLVATALLSTTTVAVSGHRSLPELRRRRWWGTAVLPVARQAAVGIAVSGATNGVGACARRSRERGTILSQHSSPKRPSAAPAPLHDEAPSSWAATAAKLSKSSRGCAALIPSRLRHSQNAWANKLRGCRSNRGTGQSSATKHPAAGLSHLVGWTSENRGESDWAARTSPAEPAAPTKRTFPPPITPWPWELLIARVDKASTHVETRSRRTAAD